MNNFESRQAYSEIVRDIPLHRSRKSGRKKHVLECRKMNGVSGPAGWRVWSRYHSPRSLNDSFVGINKRYLKMYEFRKRSTS